MPAFRILEGSVDTVPLDRLHPPVLLKLVPDPLRQSLDSRLRACSRLTRSHRPERQQLVEADCTVDLVSRMRFKHDSVDLPQELIRHPRR